MLTPTNRTNSGGRGDGGRGRGGRGGGLPRTPPLATQDSNSYELLTVDEEEGANDDEANKMNEDEPEDQENKVPAAAPEKTPPSSPKRNDKRNPTPAATPNKKKSPATKVPGTPGNNTKYATMIQNSINVRIDRVSVKLNKKVDKLQNTQFITSVLQAIHYVVRRPNRVDQSTRRDKH
jgi:hypothetical protein